MDSNRDWTYSNNGNGDIDGYYYYDTGMYGDEEYRGESDYYYYYNDYRETDYPTTNVSTSSNATQVGTQVGPNETNTAKDADDSQSNVDGESVVEKVILLWNNMNVQLY